MTIKQADKSARIEQIKTKLVDKYVEEFSNKLSDIEKEAKKIYKKEQKQNGLGTIGTKDTKYWK